MPSHSSTISQELRRLDVSSLDFQDRLNDALSGKQFMERAVGLARNDLMWIIGYLDEALGRLDPSSPVSRKCLHELRSICGATAMLPASYADSSHSLTVDPFPFASRGYSDVYKGTLDGSEVSVKRVRVYTRDVAQKAEKAFCKEAVVWKRLAHPNIAPLLCITVSPFQLISDWMPGGNVLEYLEKNPNTDRVRLLHDAAEGLCSLHSCSMVHGNLKGTNILVDAAGRARVADFCLAMATTDVDSELNTSLSHSHTDRWTAPEVLNGGACNEEADIFSFAMVTIEVFTCAVPFGDLSLFTAMLSITQGKRPPRPTHPAFTGNLWKLVQRCWDHNPHLRPEVSEVSQGLLTTNIPTWKWLIDRSPSVDECAHVMASIFSDRDEVNAVAHLYGDDAQTFVDLAHESLDSLAPRTRIRCLHSLHKGAPQCCGGFADVWKGPCPQRPKIPGITDPLRESTQRRRDRSPSKLPEASGVSNALLASETPVWNWLIEPTLSSSKRIGMINRIFSDRDEAEKFKDLTGSDARAFVDVVDKVLKDLDALRPDARRRFVRSTYTICGRDSLVPESLNIPTCYNHSKIPQASGGFADVWKGNYEGKDVAAKVLRVCATSNFKKIRKRFCREAVIWKTFRHPNVLPLIGVTMEERHFVMVSEWMSNGDIIQFLKVNDTADRLQLLTDATKGLIYMHNQGIVHGDLKGLNIMIDSNCRAVLADFGLVNFAPDQTTLLSSCMEAGTVRWMSPELLHPQKYGFSKIRPTKESDYYALGMVVYEILSGSTPFCTDSSFAILHKVLEGERPKRPEGDTGKLFTDSIWDLVRRCWKDQLKQRASARDVLRCLGGDPDAEYEADDLSDAAADDIETTD